MNWKNILNTEPNKDCLCEVTTNRGRKLILEYYEEHGFWDEDGDTNYGWKDNGYDPELILTWREISPPTSS